MAADTYRMAYEVGRHWVFPAVDGNFHCGLLHHGALPHHRVNYAL